MIPQEDSTTPAPFFPTFAPSTSALPVILLTEEPRRQEQPRKLEFLPLADTDNSLESEEVILGGLTEVDLPSLPVTLPPAPVRSRGRPSRPVPSRNFSRRRPDSVQLGRSRTPPPPRPPAPGPRPRLCFRPVFRSQSRYHSHPGHVLLLPLRGRSPLGGRLCRPRIWPLPSYPHQLHPHARGGGEAAHQHHLQHLHHSHHL